MKAAMKAMVLAAGLGTRLGPLTADRPKALVEVAGRTLLEITLARLRRYGVEQVIVNAHHFADMLIAYLKANDNFGMRVVVSREDALLDTGGGLKQAAWFFEDDAQPFVVHNVDVLSTIDLRRMAGFHRENGALATLAVSDRDTSRYLYFDESLRLCGRGGKRDPARQSLAFSGIHIIYPRLFPLLSEAGAFAIIAAYLRLAGEGERIVGFRSDGDYWRDVGRPESLQVAAADVESGVYRL
jgi:NDP-sugar pyrophosphorylase family protein